MSTQERYNPYLASSRKKRAGKPDEGSERDFCMKLFKEMCEIDEPEPMAKAIIHMRKQVADAEVQRQGCYSLAHKAITHGRSVILNGGLEAALTAMNRHLSVERLQFDGCELLWRLAMDEDGAKSVIDAGGLTAILACLALHTESVRVQEEAGGALRWLASKDPQRVMDGGGLEAVTRIMENFAQFSWIQMWCCGALLHFSQLDNKRVSELGGFRMVKAALRAHVKSPEVQRLGTLAMKLDPEAVKSIPDLP